MGYKLADEMVHVLLPEHDEVIKAFLLECLDEPFDEGIGIGRAECGLFNLTLIGRQNFVECPFKVENGISGWENSMAASLPLRDAPPILSRRGGVLDRWLETSFLREGGGGHRLQLN